jgi:hypothetical protein
MNSSHRKRCPAIVLAACAAVSVGTGCGGVSSAVRPASDSRVAAQGVRSSVRSPQDDDHIAIYGHEAAGSQRQEILRLVTRYYKAAAADDGRAACKMIHRQLASSVVEDYGQTPRNRGKTCAEVMNKIFRHVEGQPPSVLARTRVTGIRIRRKEGFAQLTSSSMRAGEIALVKDGMAWKVAVLIGRACKNCSPVKS